MKVYGYTLHGMIRADLGNGVEFTDVPDDMSNSDRWKIWDEWEMGPPDLQTGERVRINTIPYHADPAPLVSLTARQLRLGLVSHGVMLDRVEASIAAIPDAQARSMAQIEWEYASQFNRDHPLIAEVGKALGLTDAQIDVMWTVALAL
ncbi:hypothetical protein ACRQ1B_28990 [Rhizobium panacihumi]|uniref:hypothetical protein n=1 Tax=Rhizobium panacihumi TaxID=2008450 RepID=UPI003D7B0FE5